MKILYFDTETTGVDPRIHEIVQFAAIVEVDGTVKEEVNWKCQPTKWEVLSPEALAVTGMTIEKLKESDPPAVMMEKIRGLFDRYIDKFDKSDKFYPAGHNVVFDLDFLQNFWKQHGDQYGTGSYQNWRVLDSRIFAHFLIVAGKLQVEDVKLETLCKHYGIEISAHDALSDIRATRQLIAKMMEALK